MSNERGYFYVWKKNYSNELKLEIVQRYQKGNIGLMALAKEYHVNEANIQKWKAAYHEHGHRRTYSKEWNIHW